MVRAPCRSVTLGGRLPHRAGWVTAARVRRVYDTGMTTDDPAVAALHRLGQAMDLANELIGGLLRKVEEGQRPSLRVLSGRADTQPPITPANRGGLHVVRDASDADS
jgi:hypothetical protein